MDDSSARSPLRAAWLGIKAMTLDVIASSSGKRIHVRSDARAARFIHGSSRHLFPKKKNFFSKRAVKGA